MSTTAAPAAPPDEHPIEEIVTRVIQGEIDQAYARTLVTTPAVTAHLTLPYARSIAQLANQLAAKRNARAAVLVADLLRAAIAVLPDDEANAAVHTIADLTW